MSAATITPASRRLAEAGMEVKIADAVAKEIAASRREFAADADDTRLEARFDRFEAKIDRLADQMADAKVNAARLEGKIDRNDMQLKIVIVFVAGIALALLTGKA